MEDSANAGADKQEEVQATEEVVEEQSVPKSRMDELNTRMKAAEERAQQYEYALQQANGQLQQSYTQQQSPAPEQALDEDQKYWQNVLTPVLDQRLGHLEQNVKSVLDRQQRESFWSQYSGKIDKATIQQVETTMNNMRAQGTSGDIDRQDVMDFVIGRNRRLEISNKVQEAGNVQQQVEETNRVARAESGNTTTPPAPKNLTDMTADEIMSKYGGEILDD